ncbi:hypothetical protein PMAYCL1PPCAC_10884, partial [Pristionchus mayeri]
ISSPRSPVSLSSLLPANIPYKYPIYLALTSHSHIPRFVRPSSMVPFSLHITPSCVIISFSIGQSIVRWSNLSDARLYPPPLLSFRHRCGGPRSGPREGDHHESKEKKKRGALTIKIPSPTTIWHRTFKDGREKQYMESCTPGLDVCNKWRSGILGKDVHPEKISLAKDGTLNMPKVTSADSAQYYTYYLGKDGVFHYTYFDVIVA